VNHANIVVLSMLIFQGCSQTAPPYLVSTDYNPTFDYISNSSIRIEYSNNFKLINDSTILKTEISNGNNVSREIASRFANNITNEYANESWALDNESVISPKLDTKDDYMIFIDSISINSKTTTKMCVIQACGDESHVSFNVNVFRTLDKVQLIGFKAVGDASQFDKRNAIDFKGKLYVEQYFPLTESEIYNNVFIAIMSAIENAQSKLSNMNKNDNKYQ